MLENTGVDLGLEMAHYSHRNEEFASCRQKI